MGTTTREKNIWPREPSAQVNKENKNHENQAQKTKTSSFLFHSSSRTVHFVKLVPCYLALFKGKNS